MKSQFRNGADYAHNDIVNVRAEKLTNVGVDTREADLAQIETDHGVDLSGEFVYADSQLRVYNGDKIVSYVNSEFAPQDIVITWAEGDVYNDDYVRTDIGAGSYNTMIRLSYADNKPFWPFGNIKYITMPDTYFSLHHGRMICIEALNNCWFNLINNTTDTLSSQQVKITTGTGANLRYITKALLVFRNDDVGWEVLSYTRATFHRRYTIPASIQDGTPAKGGYIPADGGLPFIGYYRADVYVEVTETSSDAMNGQTTTAQTLLINNEQVAKSATLVTTGTNGVRLYNHSLVGFNRVNVTGATPSARKISYGATLPNGVNPSGTNQITGGYAEITWLGDTESEYMTSSR